MKGSEFRWIYSHYLSEGHDHCVGSWLIESGESPRSSIVQVSALRCDTKGKGVHVLRVTLAKERVYAGYIAKTSANGARVRPRDEILRTNGVSLLLLCIY